MTGLATSQHKPARHAVRRPDPGANHRSPAVLPQPVPLAKPRRQHRLGSTPRKVQAGVAAVIALAAGLCVVVALMASAVTGGFTRMGGTDAPLVEASTGVYFAVSDMDAQLANMLLTGTAAGTDPALAAGHRQAQAAYQQDRATADHDLQRITAIAASNPQAQDAIGTIIGALGQYEALAADALLTSERGHDLPGRPSSATRGYFEQATDLMATTILPGAGQLTDANAKALNASYSADRASAQTGIILVGLLGALLLGALIGLQFFLARRYRRLVNPALAAATVLALAVTIVAMTRLADQYGKLHAAKADAFDSVSALTQARAISYSSNADESRYLIDPLRSSMYQDSFLRSSLRIADVGRVGIGQYDSALAREIGAYQVNNANVEFGGYLGTEFRNITFPGERAAADRALRTWQAYQIDDRKLRALESTSLDAAIAFDIGTRPGESNWAFGQYDTALNAVIAINENAFTSSIAAGHHDGAGWNGPIPAGAATIIAVLGIAGTWRRISEYR